MEQPAGLSDRKWQAVRASGYKVLGWVAIMRGQAAAAEEAFTQSLKLDPNDANISFEMVRGLLVQEGRERQASAIFHLARAAVWDGPGALPPSQRETLNRNLENTYLSFHGPDPEGLEKLKALARTQALPPSDFTISSAAASKGGVVRYVAFFELIPAGCRKSTLRTDLLVNPHNWCENREEQTI